jgi:hypothetical protein
VSQPPIPGTGAPVHLPRNLKFEPLQSLANVGNLEEPKRQVPDHRRPAPPRGAALLSSPAPRGRESIYVPVRDLRRQERGLRDRDVRDHQLDADAHQQEPPRRPLRARVVGGARPEALRARRRAPLLRRATARSATRSIASAGAASRRSGSSRPSCSTRSTAGSRPTGRSSRSAARPRAKRSGSTKIVRDFFKLPSGSGATRGAAPRTWSPVR